MSKSSAIAVLSDEGHLEMTKHILYSSYVYGNWQGDYILLAHNVRDQSKLQWFYDRGIEVLPTQDFANVGEVFTPQTSIYYSKLRLFHPDCQRWNAILYLDTDMIVQWDINALVDQKGFAAAYDCARFPLIHQFSPRDSRLSEEEYAEVARQLTGYQLSVPAFNAGMMVIDSRNNSIQRYESLMNLVERFKHISTFGDQGILNLYFQNRFIPLPYVYNDFYQSDAFNRNGTLKRNSCDDAVILHLTYPHKPWNPESSFHTRWLEYTKKSEYLFTTPQLGKSLPRWRLWRTEFINAYNQYRTGLRKF